MNIKRGAKLTAFLTATIMMVSSNVVAYAAEEPSFVLTGNYRSENFWLTSEGKIFERNGVVPGDIWESEINLENKGSRTMLVSLLEIQNNLKEKPEIYENLKLEITDGENVLYTGPYPGEGKEFFKEYKVDGRQNVTLQAKVTMPGEMGNDYQGKDLDSTWVFEAKYPEPIRDDDDEPIKKPIKPVNPGKKPTDTGALYITSNTVPALYLFSVVTASGTLLVLSKKKRNGEKGEGPNE